MKNKFKFLVSLLIISSTLSLSFSPYFYAQVAFAQTYSGSINNLGSNTTTTTTVTTASSPAYTANRWPEATIRSYFSQYNINVNNGVTLYGLGNFAVTGIVSLKRTVDYYQAATVGASAPLSNIVVSAGTETYGVDSPVLDVLSDPTLNKFITTLATSRGTTSNGTLYQLGDTYFFQTSSSWHIIFGPSNGAFVKNGSVNFFGIVRDNFNVSHPTITLANTPSVISFPRTLTVGSTGQDVHDLQQLLNTDPYTTIAASGPGSPGSETRYFGSLTKAAVVKYQYKNNEILNAAGITTPTGIAASFTRASLGAYGNYLNALKNSQNQAALQYPTPTKPLQDITILQPSATSGLPAATSTQISVNVTPNAPSYQYSGSINNLPVVDTSGTPSDLNSTPVFTDPNVNAYNYSDPNNAANNSSQSSQPSLVQSLLPSVLQIATLFLLRPGGISGTGGLGIPHGTGLPNFGGVTLYNSNSPVHVADQWRPCGCSAYAYIMNDNSRSSTKIPSPIILLQPAGIMPLPIEGTCALGRYIQMPTAALTQCKSLYPQTNGPPQCLPGVGVEKFSSAIVGDITSLDSVKDSCSQ